MFLQFQSTQQRRACGGSAFIELQYCRLPAGTPNRKLVSIRAIQNWDLTSLYVKEEDAFFAAYRDILGEGLYNNLQYGPVDIFGINYYSEEKARAIAEKLQREQPEDYRIFLQWLADNPFQNGFYLLGL